jgi:transglutaminase-like putative cysteine protease
LLSHPRAGRMIGFSEHVDLGDVGVLRDDPTVALRFEVKDLPEPPPMRLTLRLRGTAFDAYDGRAWARTQHDTIRASDTGLDSSDTFPLFRAPDRLRDRHIQFDLEPIDPPVIFLPPRAVAIHVKVPTQILLGEAVTVQKGPEDELRYNGSDGRGLRYDVYLAADREALVQLLSPADRARYLAIPPKFSQRIGDLAHQWTDDLPSPQEKASAIEEHLRREYAYDLHSPSSGKPEPVDHFLFDSRRGHCEFFSTAMALMLRTVGVPSRNVTGFVGGTWNRFGRYYAVREGDAHSWVEAYIDDPTRPTWRTFDPTPLGGAQPLEPPEGAYYYLRDFVDALSQRWDTYVVGYDLRRQVHIFEELSRRYERLRSNAGVDRGPLDALTRAPVVAAVALVFLVGAYTLWRRRRQLRGAAGDAAKRVIDTRLDAAAALYRGLEVALQLQGITRAASVPPLRHAEELRSRSHPLADEVLSLTHVYLEARFGGASLTDAAKRNFERRVRSLRATRAAQPDGQGPSSA